MPTLARWRYRLLVATSALSFALVLAAWPNSYREQWRLRYRGVDDGYSIESYRGGVFAVRIHGKKLWHPSHGFGADRRPVTPSDDCLEQWADLTPNRLLPLRLFHFQFGSSQPLNFSVLVMPHWCVALILGVLPAYGVRRFLWKRKIGGLGFTPIIPGSP